MRRAFDTLSQRKTGYDALDERISKTADKREQLLAVLELPDLPLHNNDMELAARRRVRKRDVSFGPQLHVKAGSLAGTHSVFFGGGLLLLAVVLQLADQHALALAAATLAWGWALHLVGDVVTPNGWRPFSPVSDFSIRLPRPVARHGELLVVVAAVLVAALLIRIG